MSKVKKTNKNNIMDNWLKEHGQELPVGWFENTTGCVQEIKTFTKHEQILKNEQV